MADSGPPETSKNAVKHTPQQVVPRHLTLDEIASKELLKPLIFPNHQRKFIAFTYLVSGVMVYYMVFHHDFGPKRHVLSWIREYKERKVKEFFYIDPKDKELEELKERKDSRD